MRAALSIILALSLSLGCQAIVPNATTGGMKKRPATVTKKDGRPGAPIDVTRTVASDSALVSVQLIGKVKLISDKGAGIISNNSGGLVSDKGGGLVSDKGGGIISNNSGGYRVKATAPDENLLADAAIEVIDAEGRLLVGEDGKPISATSDQEGGYTFSATLPAENLVLRVRLYQGGELYAMLPVAQKPARDQLELDIDTGSSLSAAYVLDSYVKGSQAIYDKLPLAEAQALDARMEEARAGLEGVPTYDREQQVALTETLRSQTPALDAKLEDIKVLLIGQEDLGNGLPATQVSLTTPIAVIGDAAGNLYVAEAVPGRLRRIGTDGKMQTIKTDLPLNALHGLALGPDGALYVTESKGHRASRVSLDGKVTRIAGDGTKNGDNDGFDGPALQASLQGPKGMSVAPDGTVYIARTSDTLRVVGNDGILLPLKLKPTDGKYSYGMVQVGDEDRELLLTTEQGAVVQRKADGTLEVVASGLKLADYSAAIYGPEGWIYVAETNGHRVHRLKAGQQELVAGTGTPGGGGDGGPATAAELNNPGGLWFGKDGTLYIADQANGLIRAVAPDGTIRTVAGTRGVTQTGDVQALSINGPGGVALDPQGRLVFAEMGTGTIKRLEAGELTVIAGKGKGYAGDGGPATEALFDTFGGIAYAGSELFILSNQEERIRKIDAQGIVTTVAQDELMGTLSDVKIDPQGRPVFSDARAQLIRRLEPDGTLTTLAGTFEEMGDSGDGGAASAALLSGPLGLAFTPEGDLLFCDSANLVIRKIAMDGIISTFAGIRPSKAIAKIFTFQPGAEDGTPAKDALLTGPASMAFDPAGNLYVLELGTEKLQTLGGLNDDLGGFDISMFPVIKPRIRKITPDGKIYSIAGPGGKVLTGDGDADSLGFPLGIVIDKQGRLVIADGLNNQVKILPAAALQ